MYEKYEVFIHKNASVDRVLGSLKDIFGSSPTQRVSETYDLRFVLSALNLIITFVREKHFQKETGQYSPEYPLRVRAECVGAFNDENYYKLQNILCSIIAREVHEDQGCPVMVIDQDDNIIEKFD